MESEILQTLNGHERMVEMLLSSGASVTAVDDEGMMPIDVAHTKALKAALASAWTGTDSEVSPNCWVQLVFVNCILDVELMIKVRIRSFTV